MEPYTLKLNIAAIQPSRWQPRRAFDADALRELALSIQDQGLINPILVFQVNGHYELIAGERRTRAVIASYLTALFTQHSLLEWCARLATVGLAGMGEEERAALAAEPAAGKTQIHKPAKLAHPPLGDARRWPRRPHPGRDHLRGADSDRIRALHPHPPARHHRRHAHLDRLPVPDRRLCPLWVG